MIEQSHHKLNDMRPKHNIVQPSDSDDIIPDNDDIIPVDQPVSLVTCK
jgi:hypothetical protein